MASPTSARHIWSHYDRVEWIQHAVSSEPYRGMRHGYQYRLLPKTTDVIDDPKRQEATEATAKVVYNKKDSYRNLSLGFYNILVCKLVEHPFTSQFIWRDLMLVVKGSNAYAMLLPDDPVLPFSDLDIIISINPRLPTQLFNDLHNICKTLVLQTMSQFKKTIDHMFFMDSGRPDIKNMWMSDEDIEEFKADHKAAMREIGMLSVFENTDVRNHCSRHSFVLMNSEVYDDKVVKIEVPHFNKCEYIPLRYTPVFCSYNETLSYGTRNMELYRIKWNNMMVSEVEDEVAVKLKVNDDDCSVSVSVDSVYEDNVIPADFIDVCFLNQNDSELISSWSNRYSYQCVYDDCVKVWVVVPNMLACARDLWMMLNVYECPESKREKRQRKLDLITTYIPSHMRHLVAAM